MLIKKRKPIKFENMALKEGSSARLQDKLPPKLKEPRNFTLPISMENSYSNSAMCDTGASVIICRILFIGNWDWIKSNQYK